MLTVDQLRCTGCRACEQSCPKKCIQMRPDKDGFLFPHIRKELCIECHQCENVCPIGKESCFKAPPHNVYAAFLNNKDVLNSSASGGVFPALASMILERQGVIYGCAWNESMRAVHIRITNRDDLIRLQGSKYVQSDTRDTFTEVQHDLKEGRYVLYSGTPCQIAGLKLFLRKEYERLLTVDLICHGVPSPAMFQDYLRWLLKHKKIEGHIFDYQFRNKKIGGWGYGSSYYVKNENSILEKVIKQPKRDPYYYFFISGFFQRECCYCCQYSKTARVGDFTIGDFWGVEKIHPDFPREQGVSVLLINSSKADEYIKLVGKHMSLLKSSLENAASQNHQLERPVIRPMERDRLLEVWHREGFDGIDRFYKHSVGLNRFGIFVKLASICPKRIKTLAKKLLRKA